MTRYVIEKNHSQSAWVIKEHETGKLLGTLLKKGSVYVADSPIFRAFSESTDPVLALKDVFHTTEFYSIVSNSIHKLTPENLRAMVGAAAPKGK